MCWVNVTNNMDPSSVEYQLMVVSSEDDHVNSRHLEHALSSSSLHDDFPPSPTAAVGAAAAAAAAASIHHLDSRTGGIGMDDERSFSQPSHRPFQPELDDRSHEMVVANHSRPDEASISNDRRCRQSRERPMIRTRSSRRRSRVRVAFVDLQRENGGVHLRQQTDMGSVAHQTMPTSAGSRGLGSPPSGLSSPTHGENEEAVTLTCPSCKVSVEVVGRARFRQLCPYCGNFYNAAAQGNIGLRARNINGQQSEQQRGRRQQQQPHIFPAIETHRFSGVVVQRYGRLSGSGGLTHITEVYIGRPGSESSQGSGASLPPLVRRGSDGGSSRSVSSFSNAPNGASTSHHGGSSTMLSMSANNLSLAGLAGADGRSIRSARSVDIGLDRASDVDLDTTPVYPEIDLDLEQLQDVLRRAKETGKSDEMLELYSTVFGSFESICAAFKENPEQEGAKADNPGLKMDLVYTAMEGLIGARSAVHKALLKSVINTMMQENRNMRAKDEIRALFILLMAPIFASQSSYTVFAHLLRQITSLSNGDHQLMVGWFKTVKQPMFESMVQHLLQFITVRQFPPADISLPPLAKSRWWIPTATKVLALLNVANNKSTPHVISYTEFYNSTLDHLDLMQEYYNWQAPDRPDRFSFCQYPFILSIVAKRYILTKDSEQQMILTARRSLVAKVSRHQVPDIDIFFLNVHVRRNHLVADSLKEVARKQRDLKKKLKVSFEGEPGLDMGGLTKEWFLLLVREIFQPDYGMFVYHPNARCHWFSISQRGNLREYNLIGVLMGLAVYNSIILDLHFPHVCYRKLLTPPVVPNYDYVTVGLIKNPSTEDLAEIMPEVAQSLKELLAYEGDVEEDLCTTFQISVDEFGGQKTYDLVEDGANVMVTNQNREEFVKRYVDFILNTAIYEQFRAFYLGFHSVCASNALIMLRPEEVEIMVCGCPTLDLSELKKVVEYDGYTAEDQNIKDFWDILLSLTIDLQKRFLLFTTGSDRIPVGGMQEMTFKITAQRDHVEMLPQAHTCFNQLVLPRYNSPEVMRQKLIIAISNAEGFGME